MWLLCMDLSFTSKRIENVIYKVLKDLVNVFTPTMDNTDSIENMSDLYHNEESLVAYENGCGYEQTAQKLQSFEERFYSFPEADTYIQNFLPEDNISYSSFSDDLEATSAVFQQFDSILRQQVHTEIEVFKENINRILTDQQFQFKQAFGLPDPSLNTTEGMHVVPQSEYVEERGSEECQVMTETDKTESDGSENTVGRLHWYHMENHPSEESFTTPETQEVAQNDEEKLTLDFLVRMLTADSAITAALRRKEYAS